MRTRKQKGKGARTRKQRGGEKGEIGERCGQRYMGFGDTCRSGIKCQKDKLICEPYSAADYTVAFNQMILEGKASSVLYLIGLNPGLVNGKTSLDKTPLMLAAATQNNVEVINILIQYGATATTKNNLGETALFIACKRGHLENVKALMGPGINIDERDNTSNTLLMVAVTKRNNADVINFLMDSGANATFKNSQMDTPLLIACKRGYIENVEALINAENDISLDERDESSNTPLMIAAIQNNAKIVDVLLNAGANADIGNFSGATALMLACKGGHSASVTILLKKARGSLDIQDNEGKTALMYAVGHPRIVHQLLSAGANTDKVTRSGKTVRSLAGAYPVALKLLNEPDAKKREGLLPPTSRELFDIARRTPGTLLGKGGAGAVRAVDGTAIKRVVFDEKYLYKNVDNVSPLDAYEDEISTLMRLKGNPHVLQLIDSELYNQNAYMTTERLIGMNLRHAIFYKRIDNTNVRKVVEQMITGLQSIHDAGILHLDIKPENLWFTPGPFRGSDPSIKYLDFGDSCSEIPCIKDYSISTEGYALKDRPIDDGFYYDKSNDYYALAMTINDLIPEEDRSPENKEWFRKIISGIKSLPGV